MSGQSPDFSAAYKGSFMTDTIPATHAAARLRIGARLFVDLQVARNACDMVGLGLYLYAKAMHSKGVLK